MLHSLITVITFLINPYKLPVVSITNYESFDECKKALDFLYDFTKIEIRENNIDAIVNYYIDNKKRFLYVQYSNLPIITFSRCIKKKYNN